MLTIDQQARRFTAKRWGLLKVLVMPGPDLKTESDYGIVLESADPQIVLASTVRKGPRPCHQGWLRWFEKGVPVPCDPVTGAVMPEVP